LLLLGSLHHKHLLLLLGHLVLIAEVLLSVICALLTIFLLAVLVLVLTIELGIDELLELILGDLERIRILLVFLLKVSDKELSFLVVELIDVELELVVGFALLRFVGALILLLLVLGHAFLVELLGLVVLIGILLLELLLLLQVLVSLIVLGGVLGFGVVLGRFFAKLLLRALG